METFSKPFSTPPLFSRAHRQWAHCSPRQALRHCPRWPNPSQTIPASRSSPLPTRVLLRFERLATVCTQRLRTVRRLASALQRRIPDRTRRGHYGEGFQTTAGAAFQLETLRTVTHCPCAPQSKHWHFDHTLGNSVYGGAGIPIWAHADAASRMTAVYPKWQAEDLATFLAPWEKRVSEAKTDSQREHAKSDVEGVTGMFKPVSEAFSALPNHPLDPARNAHEDRPRRPHRHRRNLYWATPTRT